MVHVYPQIWLWQMSVLVSLQLRLVLAYCFHVTKCMTESSWCVYSLSVLSKIGNDGLELSTSTLYSYIKRIKLH